MLVLTRKIEESLVINGNITVKILDIRGGQIRLGIDAPREISVHREEVYDRIQAGKVYTKKTTNSKSAKGGNK
jgi:carbon storage regulator